MQHLLSLLQMYRGNVPCIRKFFLAGKVLTGQAGDGFVGISVFHSVMVHAREKNFSCPAVVHLFSPVKQVLVGFNPAAVQIAFPPGFSLLGVNGYHTDL